MVGSKTAQLVKKLKFKLKETNFDDVDPIFTSVFLKKFRNACGSIGIHKRAATWPVSNFTKKPASSSLEA